MLEWPPGVPIRIPKPDRVVQIVYLHCSASDRPEHDDISVMRRWHLARGWRDVGYHWFIRQDGVVQSGRPHTKTPAAQAGRNYGTYAVCCHGGLKETFTDIQFSSLNRLLDALMIAHSPDVLSFRGHKEVARKACPVFDYRRVCGIDASMRRDLPVREASIIVDRFEMEPMEVEPMMDGPCGTGGRGRDE